MTCGCGRPASHPGRCAWRRRVSAETLSAARAKRRSGKKPIDKQGRLHSLLVTIEEVHLACISFAAQYVRLKHALQHTKLDELVAADPDPGPV